MRRRSFIATLPLAAAGSLAMAQSNPQSSPSSQSSLPKFQPEGADHFNRPDVHPGDRVNGASFATRSTVYGCNGAAGTAHPFATMAAIDILKRGGSAADAAVAANACLGFLEPVSSGVGGDCYVLMWDPKQSKVMALAGSGRSPKNLSLETARARAKTAHLPPLGAVAVSVPGALDTWWNLHQRYGRLKWAELFEPAIHMAETGVPVPQCISYYIRRNLAAFTRPTSGVEETANALHTWAPSGKSPDEGEVFRNPDLARTYKLIAQGGRDAFYDGPIADTIEAYFKRIGGWMTREDLKAQHAEWIDPLTTTYRGVDVYAMAANTQGLATLQMLNILENFDLREMGFQSTASIHTQIEAKRLAYEDRARYYADPHFSKIPIDWLSPRSTQRTRQAHQARLHPHTHLSRPGTLARRHHLLHRRRLRRHDDLADPVQLPRHGLRPRRRRTRLHVPGSRPALLAQDGHPNIYAPANAPSRPSSPASPARTASPGCPSA